MMEPEFTDATLNEAYSLLKTLLEQIDEYDRHSNTPAEEYVRTQGVVRAACEGMGIAVPPEPTWNQRRAELFQSLFSGHAEAETLLKSGLDKRIRAIGQSAPVVLNGQSAVNWATWIVEAAGSRIGGFLAEGLRVPRAERQPIPVKYVLDSLQLELQQVQNEQTPDPETRRFPAGANGSAVGIAPGFLGLIVDEVNKTIRREGYESAPRIDLSSAQKQWDTFQVVFKAQGRGVSKDQWHAAYSGDLNGNGPAQAKQRLNEKLKGLGVSVEWAGERLRLIEFVDHPE